MPPSPLQIKCAALKRLIKEEDLYKSEVKEQELQLEALKLQAADEYDIKKLQEILDEARRMVPEVTLKIASHREALKSFLETCPDDEDTAEARTLVA